MYKFQMGIIYQTILAEWKKKIWRWQQDENVIRTTERDVKVTIIKCIKRVTVNIFKK